MNHEKSIIITKNSSNLQPNLLEYTNKVCQLIEASVAYETRRAYSSCLKRFMNWCEIKGFSSAFPVSPEILASYIADMAEEGLSYATIEQTMAAISTTHKLQGFTSPTESLLVKKTLKGFKREYGTAKKAGLSLDLSAHSLRSGFVTTAIRQGKSERSIMNQTGHKSTQVLRDYFIREDAIEDNAANNII